MNHNTCALCERKSALMLSHIIPKFIFRYLKKDSLSKRMRLLSNPTKPVQDGEKYRLLCNACEQKFSKKETLFSNHIFRPFKEHGFNGVKYDGEWLHYFITSVNWRTLYIDLQSYMKEQQRGCLTNKQLQILTNAERSMRLYLMKQQRNIGSIENHIFFFDKLQAVDEPVFLNNPYRFIQYSVFGYTVIRKDSDEIYVFANLAGIIIVSIIKKHPKEKWKNTYVKREAGKLKTPQYSSSPVFHELIHIEKQRNRLSKR